MLNDKPNTPKGRSDAGDKFSSEQLQDKIGQNLRKIYDDVLNEPVPEDFLNLLSDAEENKVEGK